MPKKSRIFQNLNLFKVFAALVGASWVLCVAGYLHAYDIQTDREISSKKQVNITAYQLSFDRPKGLTLFTGNVKALHDKIVLQADQIRALEENKEATADGHVQVVDTSQSITLSCGHLEYQDLMDLMTAHDHPLLTTEDEKGNPITVLGRQMELNSVLKTVVINQNVQIIHKGGRAESQKATFLSQEDKFILEDDPKVYTDNGLLSGRRIVSNLSGDRDVLIEGMADAIFNPNGAPITSSTPNKPSSPGTPTVSNYPVTNNSSLGNNAVGSGGTGTVNPTPVPTSQFRW
jgi:lipopolysaccharide export system protein LptA